MDIIVDTNILCQDHLLRSAKSQAVLDYLEKTSSHLVIPTVVKEEMIGIFKRTLVEYSEQLNKYAVKIDRWCYSGDAGVEINLNIEKEVSVYKTFIEEFTHGNRGLEFPYNDKFMGEVIRRLVGRLKPASDKGEEFRDVVIWLSVKEFLKDTKKEAVFISSDVRNFADADFKTLHPDLVAELAKEGLKLKYFSSVDDFIQQHSSKIAFVNNKWLKQHLLKGDIERLAARYIEQRPSRYWVTEMATDGFISPFMVLATFKLVDIIDFFVYEMGAGDLFLRASCRGNVFAMLRSPERGSSIEESDEVVIEVEGKVSNRKLETLEIVGRRFLKDRADFADILQTSRLRNMRNELRSPMRDLRGFE